MSFGARFLARPDLFPARQSGEPRGARSLALDLPGGPYTLSGLSPAQEAGARSAFGAFCAASEGPAAGGGTGVAVRVFTAPAEDFLPVDTRGWEYALDSDHQPAAVRLAGLSLLGRIDWNARGEPFSGALWTSEEGERFPGICENFLRVLLAYRVLDLGGAVLHSAGVVDRGRAFLFLGRSGAGKTTAASLSLAAGREVLSDDLNAVLPTDETGGGYVAARLPFAGDLGRAAAGAGTFPLAGLLRLRKADPADSADPSRPAETLAPLSPGRALATLLACSPFVNADPCRREALLAALDRLTRAVPERELIFRLDGLGPGFWSILEAELPP
jgi:hypothetical protein